MSLTVFTKNSQLVVDSRLIAKELGIEHKALIANVREHETSIESAFGKVLFQKAPSITSNQYTTVAFLTEDQSTFVMSLSRNTPQVIKAKINLVKAFSAAKKLLQGDASLDRVVSDALLKKLDKMEAIATVATEYLTVRKYSDASLPGLNILVDEVVKSRFQLPPVRIEFGASEYIKDQAPDFSRRQQICFYKEAAATYRLLKGKSPKKSRGGFIYTNGDVILLDRAIAVVVANTPFESKGNKNA